MPPWFVLNETTYFQEIEYKQNILLLSLIKMHVKTHDFKELCINAHVGKQKHSY